MAEISNKKLGNDFEKELAHIFSQHRCWVHNFATKTEGQPADLIVVHNTHAYLIDAKVCSNGRFLTSRIEPNQHTSMSWWYLLNHEYGWFALKVEDEIYMVDYMTLTNFSSVADFSAFDTLDKWLEKHNIQ